MFATKHFSLNISLRLEFTFSLIRPRYVMRDSESKRAEYDEQLSFDESSCYEQDEDVEDSENDYTDDGYDNYAWANSSSCVFDIDGSASPVECYGDIDSDSVSDDISDFRDSINGNCDEFVVVVGDDDNEDDDDEFVVIEDDDSSEEALSESDSDKDDYIVRQEPMFYERADAEASPDVIDCCAYAYRRRNSVKSVNLGCRYSPYPSTSAAECRRRASGETSATAATMPRNSTDRYLSGFRVQRFEVLFAPPVTTTALQQLADCC